MAKLQSVRPENSVVCHGGAGVDVALNRGRIPLDH